MNYINSCWFNDFARLLKRYGAEIQRRSNVILPAQKENDVFIMKHILTNSPSIITNKKFNACQLYLKVTFLSDINNLEGDTLLLTSLQGIRAQNRTSKYDYPNQQHSNTHSWKLTTLPLQTASNNYSTSRYQSNKRQYDIDTNIPR